jgi:hypothetical protein
MIPNYQRILFWSLIGSISLMAAFLLRGCEQAQRRLGAPEDATPISAPTTSSTEEVTLYLANDADASITPITASISLPQAPALRTRTLLQHLLSTYSLPASKHPLQSGPSVDDVFLLTDPQPPAREQPGQIAVINLRGAFVDNHPSGIQVEALTVQSIIGTLHAALPQIKAVRFLVDGQPHNTLAGHADLLRTYPAVDTTTKPMLPTEPTTEN